MLDRTLYLMTSPHDNAAIPTEGAAATATDLYRIVGIQSSNLADLNAAFTDVESVAAISRIAEGGISTFRDLDAAEVALQALLFHDMVHVAIASLKLDYGQGIISYLRFDSSKRSKFGFDLFSDLVASRDWLIAPEFARASEGSIVASSATDSALLGRSVEELRQDPPAFQYLSTDTSDAVNAAIEEHGVPLYLSDPELTRRRRGDGFAKHFYHRMRVSWDKAVSNAPPVVCTFSLPPLLSIVLNRLNNRSDLKAVVRELREELAPVRRELHQLNSLVTSSISQPELERRLRHIEQSFDAILPESRLSNAERRRRTISVAYRLARPLVKLMASLAMHRGLPLEEILKSAGGVEALVIEGRAVVDRTVTARTFSELAKTEALQGLVQRHLSPAEIAAIERSLRRRR